MKRHPVVERNIVSRAKDLHGYLKRNCLGLDGDGKPFISDQGIDAIHLWISREHSLGEERGRKAARR